MKYSFLQNVWSGTPSTWFVVPPSAYMEHFTTVPKWNEETKKFISKPNEIYEDERQHSLTSHFKNNTAKKMAYSTLA